MDAKQSSLDLGSSRAAVVPDGSPWSEADAAFYVRSLGMSDYVERVGPALKLRLGTPSSLLDVGAGHGPFARVLVGREGRWTAVEPNGFLVRALARDPVRGPDRIFQSVWEDLKPAELSGHETILATNFGGNIGAAAHFVSSMRSLAGSSLCWTVPAQQGPRRFCLSGFLPSDLHGEDETPGVELVLRALGPQLSPDEIAYVDWTFRAEFSDRDEAARHFISQFSITEPEPRARLIAWLDHHLAQTPTGWMASAPKASAILIWRKKGRP